MEVETPALPPLGQGSTVNNYHGPVFNGDANGAQIAWNNDTVTQNQQNVAASDVAPGFEELAKLVTELLQQLPQVGLAEQERHDTEEAANEVLKEITGTAAPEPARLRRAINFLRGALSPIGGGLISGLANGAQEWAKAAIAALTTLF